MTVGAIEALARVIGYPDGVPSGAVAFTFMVDGVPVKVGLMAASPDGDGFDVKFSDFSVRHLPDARRLEWLKANPE